MTVEVVCPQLFFRDPGVNTDLHLGLETKTTTTLLSSIISSAANQSLAVFSTPVMKEEMLICKNIQNSLWYSTSDHY